MSIDPTTLPDGTVVETIEGRRPLIKDGNGYQYNRADLGDGDPYEWGGREVFRVFVPVPDGMALADAEAALADAGAWVEADASEDAPKGARIREEWKRDAIAATLRRWVHRDDLPPADPDAELVEKMARAAALEAASALPWEDRSEANRDEWRDMARAALAALREHEAKS